MTPRTAADAYDAWWISLERPEAITASRAPPEQLAQVTQPQAEWAPPPTKDRRPPRAYVRSPTYRPAPHPSRRVFVPTYTRRSGISMRFR